jgi:hypothetical protein
MSNFKLSGKIKVIKPTEVSKSFSKREFVIETSDQYPQLVTFQITQDKCALLDNMQIGSQVEVSFNLKGREWISPVGEAKYFNTVEAWRVDKVGGAKPAISSASTPPPPRQSASNTPIHEEDSDLPF